MHHNRDVLLNRLGRSQVMKSILFFLPYLGGGGAQRVFINILKALDKNKYNLTLVVIDKDGPYLSQIPAQVKLIELNSKRVLLSSLELKRLFSKYKPDIIISGLNYANIIVALSVKWAKVPSKLILTEHSSYSGKNVQTNKIKYLMFKKLIKLSYKFADNIVCVSKGISEEVRQLTGIKQCEDIIKVIYNPIVDKELTFKSIENVKDAWINNKNFKVIISMGRLTKQKDFPTLIKAFAKYLASNRNTKVKLIVMGEGESRPELERMVNDLRLNNYVNLLGYVDNPYAYLSKADLFVLSSRSEGFGNVIVEAMACGTPVISTNCPTGPGEIIEDGINGFLVPVGDEEKLAKKISEVINNEGLQRKIAKNAFSRAQDFKVSKIVREYEQLFENT